MTWSALCTALLFTLCLTCSYSRHHIPGLTVGPETGAFQRLIANHDQELLKWVKDPTSANIYIGGHERLYVFEDSRLKQVPLSGSTLCPGQSSHCNITLLTEGNNQYPLFICGHKKDKESVCCYMTKDNKVEKCSISTKPICFQEPSLLVGEDLYFTLSGEQGYHSTLGLYKWSKKKYTCPQKNSGQRYVKMIADESIGKVYSFYIERSNDEDKEKPIWISRVSQYCMADVGGTKDHLQDQWTSMLTARLFCGDLDRGVTYTELLDVVEVKGEKWNDTIIYGLFTNPYNISAICVYKMSDIARLFSNGKFKVSDKADQTPSSPRPGKCGTDRLPSEVLRFMKTRPEMEEWLKQRPLLIEHRNYTHLQADRVKDQFGIPHNVLFLSLESGKIHKVLEKDGGSVIITEYQPFKEKTHIHDMLLDSNEAKLYVSSGNLVVKVDLLNCSMYNCSMVSDPYCNCSSISSDDSKSAEDEPTFSGVKGEHKDMGHLSVSTGSKFYLKCPRTSKQATYNWTHNNGIFESVLTDTCCILLIDDVNKNHEGVYNCIYSENNNVFTAASFQLQVDNSSSLISLCPTLLCALLLLVIFET